MTPLIVGGLVVVVIVAIAWVRVRSGRSDRRSMETYGHGLAALGDVSKRSGPSASVRVLPRGEAGRSHVRTDVPYDFDSSAEERATTRPRAAARTGNDSGTERPPGAAIRPDEARRADARSVPTRPSATPARPPAMPAPRRAAIPPVALPPATGTPVSIPADAGLKFEDRGEPWPGAGRPSSRDPGERRGPVDSRPPSRATADGPATTERPATTDGPLTADRLRPSVSPDELRRQAAMRKIVVGSVAALAVVLILAAAVLLTLHGSPHRVATPPAGHNTTSTSTTTSTTVVTTTTTPVLKAVSTSGDSATYKAPSGRYTLRFTTTSGACWVGVQPSVGSGTYLFSSTVAAGSAASYKGSGLLAVQLGAPEYVSVTLDGVPVQMPPGATYYDLVFSPS